ncbi:hypothetical protein EYF80_045766 [Liparis tanakae]|uniref:Uncharacterized protein n=1 Tax=Liparis tanakae TaxID=230148 RepID=A0A4Z2FUM4_9TELE|nr:hypothetical protein EYF80_045766 [Liparis tanakae]
MVNGQIQISSSVIRHRWEEEVLVLRGLAPGHGSQGTVTSPDKQKAGWILVGKSRVDVEDFLLESFITSM